MFKKTFGLHRYKMIFANTQKYKKWQIGLYLAKNPARSVVVVLQNKMFISSCFICRYSVVKRVDSAQKLLLATERTASLSSLLGIELETVGTFTGNAKHTRCCV